MKTMKKITLKTATFGLIGVGLITFLALYLLKESKEPNLIIISKDFVAKKTNLTAWENENSKFYYEDNSASGDACVDNVVVDLNIVSSTDGKLVRDWLKANSKYICFEDSYKHIEEAHVVKDSDFIKNIDSETNPREVSYEYIKSATNIFIRSSGPNRDFDNIGYDGYLNFFTFFGSNPRFIYDTGEVKEGSYSIPFFKSIKHRIEKEFNTTINEKDIKFNFVKTKNMEGVDVIAFTVVVTNGTSTFKEYYNFSTDPGKPISYKFL